MVAMTKNDEGALAPIHAGEHLADALEARGITRYALAKRVGMTPSAIGDIVDGKRGITARTALLLARFFGTSAEFWMALQNRYDLDVARDELGDALERVEPLPYPPDIVSAE
jgi:addiction module HigA family antidote